MEITIGERTFVIGKMPPMSTFHVMRRYLPVSQTMAAAPVTGDEKSDQQATGEASLTGWGRLSEADANYIFAECFSRVQVKAANGTLTPLWQGGHGGQLSFQDIDLGDLMGLITVSVEHNLRPTSPAVLASPSAETTGSP